MLSQSAPPQEGAWVFPLPAPSSSQRVGTQQLNNNTCLTTSWGQFSVNVGDDLLVSIFILYSKLCEAGTMSVSLFLASPASSTMPACGGYETDPWQVKCRSNSVQFSRSVMSDSLQPHGLQHARLPCPSPNSQSLHKLMSIQSVMPSNHLILYHPLLFLSSVFPSIRIFSNESVLHIRWPKYWNFSFSISPSNEYSELISFRIAWFDLLAVQGTLESLLQHRNWKTSI